MNKLFLTIHEFAKLCRTTPRTLRFYEEKGLLTPKYTYPKNNYRYYAKEQVSDFLRIKLMQTFHVSLEKLVNAKDDPGIHKLLTKELEKKQREIEEKKKEYAFLMDIEQTLFANKNLLKEMTTESMGPYILFSLDIKQAEQEKMHEKRKEVWEKAQAYGIAHKETDVCFYASLTFVPKQTQLEVAVICTDKDVEARHADLPPGYYFRSFPRISVMTYTYTGPYEYAGLVQQRISEELSQRKIHVIDRAYDVYIKNVFTTASPYDYITKFCYPVAE